MYHWKGEGVDKESSKNEIERRAYNKKNDAPHTNSSIIVSYRFANPLFLSEHPPLVVTFRTILSQLRILLTLLFLLSGSTLYL